MTGSSCRFIHPTTPLRASFNRTDWLHTAAAAPAEEALLLLLLGAWPSWPHSRGWGYYPSGTLGLVLVIVLVLALVGRI